MFYTDATSGITANFIAPQVNTGIAAGDTYSSIEVLSGSNFDDFLTSGNDNNDLLGQGGNDILVGAGGADRLFGGDGNDRLLGGTGNDDLFGQGGADTYVIRNNAGSDRIFGFEQGIDKIELEGGPAVFEALTLVQNGTNVVLTSTNGTTTIMTASVGDFDASDFVFNNPGPDLSAADDVYSGTAAANTINGLAGNDTIRGLAGDDTLNGGDGNDTLFGGEGADALNGGDGFDRAFYTDATSGITANFIAPQVNTGIAAGDTYSSIEVLSGSSFDDFLTSGNDNNDLLGQDGNDILVGAGGADRLFGGNGNDRLLGGTGNDDLFGQGGNDTFVIRANAGNDRIFDFVQGEDIIEFEGGPSGFGDLTIAQSGANVTITSSNGTTTIINATAGDFDGSDFTFRNPAAPQEKVNETDLVSETPDSFDFAEATSPEVLSINDEINMADCFGVYDGMISKGDMLAELFIKQVQADPIYYTDDNGVLAIMTPDDAEWWGG